VGLTFIQPFGGHSREAVFDAALKAVEALGHQVDRVDRNATPTESGEIIPTLYFLTGAADYVPTGTKMFLWVLEAGGHRILCVSKRGRLGAKKVQPVAQEIFEVMKTILQ
jgi:hypothetical protein